MIRVPTQATLSTYGLSLEEWTEIMERQDARCAVCGKRPPSGRLVIDHEHVRGWRKLPPWERKRYVRGLTCWFCNYRFLARGMSPGVAQRLLVYLTDYENRRPA